MLGYDVAGMEGYCYQNIPLLSFLASKPPPPQDKLFNLLDGESASLLQLGSRELGSVQDVSVALAVAVVDGQLLHGLQLAAVLDVLARL